MRSIYSYLDIPTDDRISPASVGLYEYFNLTHFKK